MNSGFFSPYLPELNVLLIALIVFLVLSLVARIVTRILARITRPFRFIHEVLLKIKDPLHLLIPLFGLQAVWGTAADDILYISAVRHVNSLAIIATVTWLGLRVAASIQEIIVLSHPVDVSDNFHARRIQTQTRVLIQTLSLFVLVFGAAGMLMTFPAARQFGTSLLASAGLAGLAVGFAAKPVLGNLIAGLQIAITQPIRLDDVVIVENEWGRVQEITGTYVVIKIWDERRLVVPLQYFIETPFQNWTRRTSTIIGSVFFWVDYSIDLAPLRAELDRLLDQVTELWDGRVKVLQVTDTSEKSIQLRILASSPDSSKSWDLRCYLREHMINFINCQYPGSLPQLRATLCDVNDEANNEAQTGIARPDHDPERQPPV